MEKINKSICFNLIITLLIFSVNNVYSQTTADLTILNSQVTNVPTDAVVSWHTATPATDANEIKAGNPITDATAVPAGTIYYMAFKDVVRNCFSPTIAVPVLTNTNTSPTVDLTSLNGSETNNPGSGVAVSWHTTSTASGANLVSNPNAVSDGIFYAGFYDAGNTCYSDNTNPVIVVITKFDNDNDGIVDTIDLDDDNDGILDILESGGNIPNGDEDGDGIPNYLDTTDNGNGGDGSTTNYTDSNGDGIPDIYDTDNDGIPNHLDLDSDNDGISDLIEAGGLDVNNDGRADDDDNNADNTSSNGIPTSAGTGLTPTSSDGDSIPDYLDLDADNDGIPDNIEAQSTLGYVAPTGVDTDNDGLDDAYDSDCTGANCSGVTGVVITPVNTDNTDTPDYLDLDSDNDGFFDVVESGSGLANDGSGVVTGAVGSNGLVDAIETGDTDQGYTDVNGEYDNTQADNFTDTDGDVNTGGDVDYRDAVDTDNDGVPDSIDLDDDNDGILDTLESGGNVPNGDEDGDGIPNYLDTTDNGNGGDGSTTNYTDSNVDGIPDIYDTDKDGIPNHFDLDSDNDGCPDSIEAAVPTVLQTSGVSTTDGIVVNTINSVINVTSDLVGNNGFANSLENVDTNVAISLNTFTTSNYTTYALDNTKNGCGTPMITQVYWKGSEKIVEVTNNDASKIVVPNAANLNLFNAGILTSSTFTASNTAEITAGKSMLFSASGTIAAQRNGTAAVIANANVTGFDNTNDIITISRISKPGTSNLPWDSRVDVIQGLTDNTSFVRIDETLVPNTTYTASEWVKFIDDDISTTFNDFLRHPHAPLLSEITSGVNIEANALLGLHRFGITTRTTNTWNNGYPDRSRFVIIDENYNQTGARLSARKLNVNASRNLSVTDQLLVVTNDIVLNGEIRLAGSSQLVQTHTSSTKITGSGKLLIDQNSEIANIYRYNYMGSPVVTPSLNTYSVATVFKDGTNPTSFNGVIGQGASDIARDITFVSGYDGSVGVPINLADYWVYTFASANGTQSSWSQKFRSGTIASTDGFIFKGPGVGQNYTFSGSPNDGTLITTVGGNESYLLGNPFPSSLNGLKFIQDNINSIDGSLYFWDHVGEEDAVSKATSGHNFAGYIGGYATLNLSLSVSGVSKPSVGVFNVVIESENAVTNSTITTDLTRDVVSLNTNLSFIEFQRITRATDVITLTYSSSVSKDIRLVINGVAKEYSLPASPNYGTFQIDECIKVGTTLRFESLDTKGLLLDHIAISDNDGVVSCAPSSGTDASLYKTPGTYVPVGQGFFIGGDSDGGSIVFNNSQRQFVTESSGNAVFFKSAIKNSKKTNDNGDFNRLPYIKLGMDFMNDEGLSLSRQIGVSFSNTNTFDFDKGYDSPINDLGATDIYWKFPNNEEKYVIAGVGAFSTTNEIPLEIIMNYSGTNIFKIDELHRIEEEVFLKDKLSNKIYSLSNNEVSLFLKEGVYRDRFSIVFSNAVLSLDDTVNNLSDDKITVFMDSSLKEIVIKNHGDLNIRKVELFNVLGQKVGLWNTIEKTSENRLKVKNISNEIYIVNILTDKGKISKKLIRNK